MVTYPKSQSGFALIMSLIVVGIVISIGISILEISVKQVRLSTNARDSEVAFHAANAGMECARYIRRSQQMLMEAGQAITPNCFGDVAPDTGQNSRQDLAASGDVIGSGSVYKYNYAYTWGTVATGGVRCTEATTLVAVADLPGPGVTTTNMSVHIPGYQNGNAKFCEAGARCTVVSVRGYNRTCSATSTVGTVQREVLVEF